MSSAIDKINSRRMWSIPDFQVWGLASGNAVEFLTVECVQAESSILYGEIDIGDTAQQVAFADLADHRGNALPNEIKSARVIVRPRGAQTAFVVGTEGASGFKIARDPNAPGPVAVDLLVIEMGD